MSALLSNNMTMGTFLLSNNMTMETLLAKGRMQYKYAFKPLRLNGITIPNRIYLAPFGIDNANLDGTMSEGLNNFYVGMARGGCGLIMLSNCTVSPTSIFNLGGLQMHSMHHANSFKSTVKDVERYGGILGIQLQHYGAQATTSHAEKELLSPSGIPSSSFQKKDPNYCVRVMTLTDIKNVKQQFIDAAVMSASIGIKFITLQASNGYLLNSFMSPRTNKRTDNYGGSIANRVRLLIEIIKGIKLRLQNDVILSTRIGIDDCLGQDGLQVQDFKEIMPLLEDADIDMISASIAVAETFDSLITRNEKNVRNIREKVRQVKSYTYLPVAFSGYTDSLDTIDELLEDKVADFIGMARSLFADNDIILKSIDGRFNEINCCQWDGNCFKDKFNPALDKVYCCVNPKYKRPASIVY